MPDIYKSLFFPEKAIADNFLPFLEKIGRIFPAHPFFHSPGELRLFHGVPVALIPDELMVHPGKELAILGVGFLDFHFSFD